MRLKWYLPILFTALVLLGANAEKATVANQEIVVQFSDTSIEAKEVQTTVSLVKKQLEALGASQIAISKNTSGELTIRYYSKIDVANLASLFSSNSDLEIDYASTHKKDGTPVEEQLKNYKLNISEIQQANVAASDSEGLVVKPYVVKNHFYNTAYYTSPNPSNYEVCGLFEAATTTCFFQKGCIAQYERRVIPEVRAGPLS